MKQSSPNHHSGGLKRLPCRLVSPVVPCHTSSRDFWFLVVNTIQITVMATIKPPSVSV